MDLREGGFSSKIDKLDKLGWPHSLRSWIGLTSSLDYFCLSEFDAACLSNLSAYELKSCKRRRELIIKKQRYGFE